MDTNRRQFALLGAILVVLAIVLYWQSTRREPTPEEFSAAARAAAGAGMPGLDAAVPPGPGSRPARAAEIAAVELASLDRAQPEPSDTGRDPFSFGAAPAARPPAGSAATGGPSPPAPQTIVPGVPPGPPPPPPITLKFIGVARQGAGRLYAVLRDDRGMYYGADGDVIEGRYRILRVTMDTVEVSYVDGRGRVSIPLSGGGPRP